MINSRDLKRRIKSVKNTQQITRAMKVVSASKLRRAQTAAMAVRPYAHKMESVISHIAESGIEHELITPRKEIKHALYLIIGSERGLCGGFNNALNHFAEQIIEQESHDICLITLGRKVHDFCQCHHWHIELIANQIGDNPSFSQAQTLAHYLQELYLNGTYDQVHIIYSRFMSVLHSEPEIFHLLPVQTEHEEKDAHLIVSDYILEPNPHDLLDVILGQYIETMVYSLLQESKASEHGARMTAMNAATDNAADMIDKLTLSLNQARQASITTEISEIISGAAALE